MLRHALPALALCFIAATAEASTYTQNIVIDLSGYATGSSYQYIVANATSSAISYLNTGDTVNGNISFANGSRVQMLDDFVDYFFVYYRRNNSSSPISVLNTYQFTGVTGSIRNGGSGSYASSGNNSGIAIGAYGNLTDGAFVFSGLTYSFTVTSGSATNFTPYSSQISQGIILPAATAGVPEPATWAMMIAGFGLVGGAMRRRQVPALA